MTLSGKINVGHGQGGEGIERLVARERRLPGPRQVTGILTVSCS